MEGFSGSSPILVKVTWTDGEVPLTSPRAMPWGLLADVVGPDGVITHWCAPWTSVVYIRQQLTAEESGVGVPDPDIDKPEKPDKPKDDPEKIRR